MKNALQKLAWDPGAPIAAIRDHLDSLTHGERMAQLSQTTRADQRLLWHKAAASEPITLEHFLPESVPPLTEVTHHGRNTLPLPDSQRFFAKPMVRPEDGSQRAFGYNRSPSENIIGPGYFVMVSTDIDASWQPRGAWVVDYFQFPDGPVPTAWPKVRSNKEGLQRFVYHGTRDFMRKVSDHVSIGTAYKGEKPLDHYFTLCREDR